MKNFFKVHYSRDGPAHGGLNWISFLGGSAVIRPEAGSIIWVDPAGPRLRRRAA
jgi:hypothetical protein